MSQESLGPEYLIFRVRCPGCHKLFAVESAEVNDRQPKFKCSQCQTRFWVPFPECIQKREMVGFLEGLDSRLQDLAEVSSPTNVETAASTIASFRPDEDEVRFSDMHERSTGLQSASPEERIQKSLEGHDHRGVNAPRELARCPRCEADYRYGDTECPKCGVVFSKLANRDEVISVPSSPQLRRLWYQVVDDYDSMEVHRKFVKACREADNLAYASQQYRRVLSAHSGDETALQMQREIGALAIVASGMSARSIKIPFVMPRVSTWFMILGSLMIAVGITHDLARNMVGLGAAVVFLAAALRRYVTSSR